MTGIAINLLALAAIGAYLLWRATPATEAVRMRNALLLKPSQAADFTWIPPDFPADFKVEHRPATREFREIADSLGMPAIDGDWKKALALATHLVERAEDKGPIRADPLASYRAIRQGYGYCADFVKVFLALAHASGLAVRQWGFSFDGFGGHGHTVVEVFVRQHGRWVMLDVYNNFHFADTATGRPLGTLESRAALQGRGPAPSLRPNGCGRPGFVHDHKALEYYRRGIDQWYLIWGNAVISHYANPWVRILGGFSRILAHGAAIVAGVQPGMRIYEIPENAPMVREMFALRRRLRALAWLFVILLATLVVQWSSGMGIARLGP